MKKPVKKIGLYGGTFDPIHFGHLYLAQQIKEIHQFDEIWFFPTGKNPFKLDKEVTDAKHRLEMTQLAINDFPDFIMQEHECKREGITYAIDTIRELQNEYGPQGVNINFSIVLGNDAALGVLRWKEIDQLIDMVPFIVGNRTCFSQMDEIKGDHNITRELKKGFTPTKVMEISSSEVRERIRQKLPCSHLVPLPVLNYIEENRLYF